ncbi:hypothetical protein NC651_039060 [Populus alba x Populus x berolinensis]|nr:hypothetical protein NC651_039060 [Populus alba x Populus x berolinensis]
MVRSYDVFERFVCVGSQRGGVLIDVVRLRRKDSSEFQTANSIHLWSNGYETMMNSDNCDFIIKEEIEQVIEVGRRMALGFPESGPCM